MPNFIILYVNDPQASAAFYTGLLGRKPVESSPTFVMFVFENGFKLGLWSRKGVEPAAQAAVGGAEIVLALDTPEAVDAAHSEWSARGVAIAQAPTDMDFGHTFVALDPDKHRLRVYCLAEDPR